MLAGPKAPEQAIISLHWEWNTWIDAYQKINTQLREKNEEVLNKIWQQHEMTKVVDKYKEKFEWMQSRLFEIEKEKTEATENKWEELKSMHYNQTEEIQKLVDDDQEFI